MQSSYRLWGHNATLCSLQYNYEDELQFGRLDMRLSPSVLVVYNCPRHGQLTTSSCLELSHSQLYTYTTLTSTRLYVHHDSILIFKLIRYNMFFVLWWVIALIIRKKLIYHQQEIGFHVLKYLSLYAYVKKCSLYKKARLCSLKSDAQACSKVS